MTVTEMDGFMMVLFLPIGLVALIVAVLSIIDRYK